MSNLGGSVDAFRSANPIDEPGYTRDASLNTLVTNDNQSMSRQSFVMMLNHSDYMAPVLDNNEPLSNIESTVIDNPYADQPESAPLKSSTAALPLQCPPLNCCSCSARPIGRTANTRLTPSFAVYAKLQLRNKPLGADNAAPPTAAGDAAPPTAAADAAPPTTAGSAESP